MIALLQKLSKILEGEKCWKWYTNFVLPLLLMLIINISTRHFHHRNIHLEWTVLSVDKCNLHLLTDCCNSLIVHTFTHVPCPELCQEWQLDFTVWLPASRVLFVCGALGTDSTIALGSIVGWETLDLQSTGSMVLLSSNISRRPAFFRSILLEVLFVILAWCKWRNRVFSFQQLFCGSYTSMAVIFPSLFYPIFTRSANSTRQTIPGFFFTNISEYFCKFAGYAPLSLFIDKNKATQTATI